MQAPALLVFRVSGERGSGVVISMKKYGTRLTTATLPGDGWRIQHDCILWRIVADAREMGAHVQPNVYGLFAASIPQ